MTDSKLRKTEITPGGVKTAGWLDGVISAASASVAPWRPHKARGMSPVIKWWISGVMCVER